MSNILFNLSGKIDQQTVEALAIVKRVADSLNIIAERKQVIRQLLNISGLSRRDGCTYLTLNKSRCYSISKAKTEGKEK